MKAITSVYLKTGKIADDEILAQSIYEAIRNYLNTSPDNTVDIDFEGVEIVLCKFWSYAIGQLYRDFSLEVLNDRVNLSSLSIYQENTLRLVLESARKFYEKEKSEKD
jgi:STAS-like domain of unknown function (DUF4325)